MPFLKNRFVFGALLGWKKPTGTKIASVLHRLHAG
jgi:hypothetical protein